MDLRELGLILREKEEEGMRRLPPNNLLPDFDARRAKNLNPTFTCSSTISLTSYGLSLTTILNKQSHANCSIA